MRTERAIAALLLLAALVLQVSTVEDIYWEGEEGASNEFLEVKEDLSPLKRLKRFDWFNPLGLLPSSTTTTTPSPANYEAVTEDEDEDSLGYNGPSDGSGESPNKIEPDPSEKTLRVTFVVMEPYLDDYSNRDSRPFQEFSQSLASAVNSLFDSLPGTQKTSLVRIQSRVADNFSCKVTLDIVTSVDNTDQISDLLHNHIRYTRSLGSYTLTDADFSAEVVNPGSPFETCQPDEIQCADRTCVAGSKLCDGRPDCSDGADEKNCGFGGSEGSDQNQEKDDSDNQVENVPNRAQCDNPIPCASSSITLCPEQLCDGTQDCPLGEDEDYETCRDKNEEQESGGSNEPTTPAVPNIPQEPEENEVCPSDEFRCDETRCISRDQVCDSRRDCSDGTDERDCKTESCGADDFHCSNNKCIAGTKRCDGTSDCPDSEDELDCECTSDEFRCNDDGSCIEGWRHCDGIANCHDASDETDCTDGNHVCAKRGMFRCGDGKCISILLRCDGFRDCRHDGSDEFDCPCSSDQWQCDQGNCIKRNKRCDGRVDCPTDRSDERNCVATGYFKCSTGKVIPDSLRCDRQYDCPPGDYSDERNCPCGDEDFRCDNGYCIQAYKRCDRTHDCQDGSDEHNCKYGTDCMAYEFKCTSGECVHAEARCNGTVECADGSDEAKTCPCKRGQFRCHDGSCINIVYRCDTHRDCSQGEDELNCPGTRCPAGSISCYINSSWGCAVRCDKRTECDSREDEDDCDDDKACKYECDGKCITGDMICNQQPDCADGRDESTCDNCDGPDDFRCDDSQCVSASSRCNGAEECDDKSDEKNCNVTISATRVTCAEGQFQCRDGNCVNGDFACDGRTDCVDESDEQNCLWSMARASRSPPVPCRLSEFTCYNGRCIPLDRRCDNIYDCSDFSDEQKCHSACKGDEYQCDNGQCIPVYLKCDKNPDCDDYSDETFCTYESEYPDLSPPSSPEEPTTSRIDEAYGGPRPSSPNNGSPWNPRTEAPSRYPNNELEEPTNGDTNDIENQEPATTQGADDRYNPYVPTRPERPEQGKPDSDSQSGAGSYPGGSYPGGSYPDSSYPDSSYPNNRQPGSSYPGGGSGDTYPNSYPYSGQDSGRPGASTYSPYAQGGRPGSSDPYATGGGGSGSRPGYNDRNGDGSYPGGSYPGPSGSGSSDGYDTNNNSVDSATSYPGSEDGDKYPVNPSVPNGPSTSPPYQQPGYEPNGAGGNSDDYYGSGSARGRPGASTYSPYAQGGRPGSSDPYGAGGAGGGGGGGSGSRPGYNDRNGDGSYPGGSYPGQSGSGSSDGYDTNNNSVDSGNGYPGSEDSDKYPDTPSVPSSPSQQPGYEPNGDGYYGSGSARGGSVGCNSAQWRCENGPCIEARQRCDGHIDCPFDFSDEFDCPAGSPVTLNVKTYPEEQSVRFGGDVVFQCRDEGPLRANVTWIREGNRKMKPGYIDNQRGRLELYKVTVGDSGVYICQTLQYQGYPGSQVRVTLNVRRPDHPITAKPQFVPCKPYEATCGNGQCIPKSSVCDTKIDCADRSDEDSCTYGGKCEPNQFQCNNRKCVLKSWVCDSDDDCGDGSDERSCPDADPTDNCMPMEYACASGDQCIPKSFRCDKHSDCIDGSDETGCSPVYIRSPPKPSNVRLNLGETLQLSCSAVGVPEPLISWRLNWGHVPAKCTATSKGGVGNLSCPNMMPEDSGAYSCEVISYIGTLFATPDAIVFVNQTDPCPQGFFNNEARSQSDCIRCFCFGKTSRCRSADLFTYSMPTPLGEGGTRLVGVALSDDGKVRTDSSITNHYYYNPLKNGATVTKLESREDWLGNFHPYLTLPESYNGNQLTSYGGAIKYTVSAHTQSILTEDEVPAIIVKGKYATLYHMARSESREPEIDIVARFLPVDWKKPDSYGRLIPASREDIMLALDAIEMILLRADNNNAGVNITQFEMESAHNINSGLGAASLVEECTCPEGYDGLSCEKCKPGYELVDSGQWLGQCVRKQCPPGTFGDPRSGYACRPCPCPLTNRDNQFANTCSLGSDGSVTCDCFSGYEGQTCEKCAAGFVGNPLIAGDKCRVPPSTRCDPAGTRSTQPLGECDCKENVRGRYCNECKEGSFFLSSDFRDGCAQCFCSGESSQCMSSKLRRKTTEIRFSVPSVVAQTGVYTSSLANRGNFKYTAPVQSQLQPELGRSGVMLSGLSSYSPLVYYWSMPMSFNGDKVTSYGGYLRYTLDNVPSYIDPRSKNTAADVILISENHLTYQYFNKEHTPYEGIMNVSIPLMEKGWQRTDGVEVPRGLFLLALADVKAILIKATYSNGAMASPLFASIDTAASDGDGPAALHVEECVCPPGHIGTSCEDCATGYTRGSAGIYLGHCEKCQCNGHSESCHPETGECYECLDHTEGPHCEQCKPGYESDGYDSCISIDNAPARCDPRGSVESYDEYGSCSCKRNVVGELCDRCRPGTFGLDSNNPDGCLTCFCSGATSDCQEARNYSRVALPAPILGDNYGGYTIMDIGAETVINENFNPVPGTSELMSNLHPADKDLYWSLPIFPGNRVLSYGGSLSLRQEFKSNDYYGTSEPGNDVILVGDDISVSWTNPAVLRSGEALSYQVPLREEGWTLFNQPEAATRIDFMRVLKSLRRVLVKATLAPNIITTTIADVAMDTATDMALANVPTAKGIEICMCPRGHQGTSCETCVAGFYRNKQDFCEVCPCNGHDCQLDNYDNVQCNCRPPYTGPDCSTIGLVMELHPTIRDLDSVLKHVTLMCKYSAPEMLTIKFVVEGKDVGTVKWANESNLLNDGWHGQHELQYTWDTSQPRRTYECHTITQRGSTLGVLFTNEGGQSQTTDGPLLEPSVSAKIFPKIITIQEIGHSVNFTCQAQSSYSQQPRITWSKTDGELPQGRYSIDRAGARLIIKNLQITDSGQYTCHTYDGHSTNQDHITLKVPGNAMTVPTVRIRQPESAYYVGDRIEVQCLAEGNPKPRVSWQRASRRPLPASVSYVADTLIIDDAREEDSGEYRCIATNNLGSSENSVAIGVRPRPAQPPRDRLVVSPLEPVVNEGQSTTIVCTGSTAVPAGTIDWIRQDGARFQANVRSDNGVLYIEEAIPENAAVYICQSRGAEVDPAQVTLAVNPAPTSAPNRSYVTVPEKFISIASGKSGTVECYPHGSLRIKWSKNENEEFGRGVSQRGNTLIINEVEMSDTGYYVCDGLDASGRTVSSVYVHIDVERREAPRVQIYPEGEQVVRLGQNQFQFRCNVIGGIPAPDIVWSRPGRQLSSHVEMKSNNILWFNEIEVNDDGEYVCTGTNEVGSASSSARLKVRSPPEVAVTPSDFVEVSAGEPVNIECHAEGHPKPRVTITGPDGRVISSEWLVAPLHIETAGERDAGEYVCTATNDADSITHSIEVRVNMRGDVGFNNFDESGSGDPDIDPGYNVENEPNWENPDNNIDSGSEPDQPQSLIAIEGQTAYLACNVTRGYTPIWGRSGGVPLQNNAVQEGSQLVIANVSFSDAGLYECSLYDESMREIRTRVYAEFRVVPKLDISLKPRTQTVFPGNSPTVECIVTGQDVIDVTWRPTTKAFSSRVQVNGRMLIFRRIEEEDAGQYECVARSRYGSASKTAEVIVVEESDVEQRESHEHEQWVHTGAGVVLSCNATGTGVRVVWTKDGSPVPRSVTARRDGSLYIRLAHASHSGRYVCHITDSRNRHTNNYINLHIEGNECLSTEFRCVDSGSCIDAELVCNELEDCSDGSDEEACFMRDKRYSAGPREALVEIEQPRRQFRVGENADVVCKSKSRDVTVEWIKRDERGIRQYVQSYAFGDGSMLTIRGVEQSDAGEYLCIGRNRFGQNYTDTFNLQIIPDSTPGNQRERNVPVQQYSARLRGSVSLPCNHDLEEPVSIQWRREYVPLPADVRTTQPNLLIENVNEGSAGTYVCRAGSGRGSSEFRALLRVIGVVPRFDGNGWLALSTLTDAYVTLAIEISFKPTDNQGLILYNSQDGERDHDFIALLLDRGIPEFVMDAGDGAVSVKGDRPLALNQWHTIRINRRLDRKVTMEVDDQRPAFESDIRQQWASLELRQPLYIGGVPDYDQLPEQLAGMSGFEGCVSSLKTGSTERNLMVDQLDINNVKDCDTCAENPCQNGAICQESRTPQGYTCLCAEGWTGVFCERRGEGCRAGRCGPGKCVPTQDGYKCTCPGTHTGTNCEIRQLSDYPAFSGSSYLAVQPPPSVRYFRLSLKAKASSPMTDGLIMYCAESARNLGGFTSIAVRNGIIEFHYDVDQGNSMVLRSRRPLPTNEWTDIEVKRSGKMISLDINRSRNDERVLDSAKSLKLETLIYIGGTDDSVFVNPRVGINTGFQGCIKDLKVLNDSIDMSDPNVESSNLRECSDAASVPQRGDIQPQESESCSCQNGGTCVGDGSCACPPGFSGFECETRLVSTVRRPWLPRAPCAGQPCLNGGTCRVDYTSLMNHTCDCPLGYAGASCQIPWRMEQSVAFSGNGYLELPQTLVDYQRPGTTPAVLALRVSTQHDGVLLYQQEARAPAGYGDFLLIRIEDGHVVLEWDVGGGPSSLSLDSTEDNVGFIADGKMHQIVVKLLSDSRVELSVDGVSKSTFSSGLASTMNADSNIFIGGIPDTMNAMNFKGLTGCLDQVEFMDTGSGVNLGEMAISAINSQPCTGRVRRS